MKLVSVLTVLLLGPNAIAVPLLNGDYACSDGGTLSLSARGDGYYSASLNYIDGASSALDSIKFDEVTSTGIMYPDDDGTLGTAQILGGTGTRVILNFNGGREVFCKNIAFSALVEETM